MIWATFCAETDNTIFGKGRKNKAVKSSQLSINYTASPVAGWRYNITGFNGCDAVQVQDP